MSTPRAYWGTRGLLPQPHVLHRGRVRVAGNEAGPALLDARPHAPDERQVVDGHVDHLVVDDRLDAMEERLALLGVALPALLHEEIVDLGIAAVGVDAVANHVGLELRRGVAVGGAHHEDHAPELLLAPRR